jgi:DNA primase
MDLDKGLFNCFSCGASGDLVDFVRLRDGVDFREAARRLGALEPINSTQARQFTRERDARERREQAKRNAWAQRLEGLLSDMQGYESVRGWAFSHREDELQGLAQEGITVTGQRYVLAKLEEYASR